MRTWRLLVPTTLGCLLSAGMTGCESLQKKFTRQPKHPQQGLSAIITFEDYTRAMTPVDRYRKHYMMFDYWNTQLMDALQDTSLNPKRYRRASTESLSELQTMKDLLQDEVASQLGPLTDERAGLDRRFQRGDVTLSETNVLVRTLERQTRDIHRGFFWRQVQDHLKAASSSQP